MSGQTGIKQRGAHRAMYADVVYAADDQLGRLTERGQHWRNETVAELGGAVLLECMGQPVDADLGGCWSYVSAYARDSGLEPIAACNRVLKRTCDAVALILDTAEKLAASQRVQTSSGTPCSSPTLAAGACRARSDVSGFTPTPCAALAQPWGVWRCLTQIDAAW